MTCLLAAYCGFLRGYNPKCYNWMVCGLYTDDNSTPCTCVSRCFHFRLLSTFLAPCYKWRMAYRYLKKGTLFYRIPQLILIPFTKTVICMHFVVLLDCISQESWNRNSSVFRPSSVLHLLLNLLRGFLSSISCWLSCGLFMIAWNNP